MSWWRIAAGQVGELSGGGGGRDGPAIAAFSSSAFPCGIVQLARRPVFFFLQLAGQWWSHVVGESIQRTRGFGLATVVSCEDVSLVGTVLDDHRSPLTCLSRVGCADESVRLA